MEKLYFNLSEEEFTKSRKVLLWIFVGIFFAGALYVGLLSPLLGIHDIEPSLCIAPLGISIIVGIIAIFATVKRKNIFFSVDDDRIEFRYGLLRPQKHSFAWADIKELDFPRKDKKIKLVFKDDTSFIINLTWLQKKKSSIIRKHIYHAAKEKGLNIITLLHLH
jgi:hypothetical protein